MDEDNKRMGRQQEMSKKNAGDLVNGTTYFVGIGINDYQNWPSLQNAMRDVRAVADVLVAEYGFNKAQLRLLLNEEATEANIIQLFEDLANQIEPADSLLVYYAGHGHLNQRGRGFWVPVDAPEGSVFRYIRNSTIKDYIGDINSLHTLLISDACFSGSLFSSGAERSSELVADELARLPSRWAICSGRHDETVADGPSNGQSPFAESILDVLRNNTRLAITTGFLVNQVIDQTRSNYQQLPDGGPLQNVGHKRGQFVFRRQRGAGAKILWQQIQSAPDSNLAELAAKKSLIRQYANDYPAGEHLSNALQTGSQLEQKHQMLEVWNSEFGLMAFIQKNTSYKQEAQQRLKILQDHSKQQPKTDLQQDKKAPQMIPEIGYSKAQTNFVSATRPTQEKESVSDEPRNAKTFQQSSGLVITTAFLGGFARPQFLLATLTFLFIIILFILLIIFSYRLGQNASSYNMLGKLSLFAGLTAVIGNVVFSLIGSSFGVSLLSLLIGIAVFLFVFVVSSIVRYRKQ